EHDELVQRLDLLEKLINTDADRQEVAGMRRDLATYESALLRVVERIRSGALQTPQDANAAIAPYKDALRALDTATEAMATRYSKAMAELDGVLNEQVRHTLAAVSAAVV